MNRKNDRLGWQLAIVVLAKIAFLIGLKVFFFNPDTRLDVDGEVLADHLLMPDRETGLINTKLFPPIIPEHPWEISDDR